MELNFSISSLIALFLLYLIILGNFTADILGCRIQEFFTEVPASKHLVCFFTLYYFINLTSNEYKDPNETLVNSAIMYLLFLLSRDIPFHYIIVCLIAMFIIKYIEDYKNFNYKNNKKKDTKYHRLHVVQKALVILIFILFFTGFIKYTFIQKSDHKKNWNWYHYIIGKSNYICASLKDTKTLGSAKGRLNLRKAINLYQN